MVLEAVTARFGAPPHEIAATVLGGEDRETLHARPRLTHTPILMLVPRRGHRSRSSLPAPSACGLSSSPLLGAAPSCGPSSP